MMKNTYQKKSSEVPQEINTNVQRNGQISVLPAKAATPNTAEDVQRSAAGDDYVDTHVVKSPREAARDRDTGARKLLIGIVLASIAGLILTTLYFVTERDNSADPIQEFIPASQETQLSPEIGAPQTIERETPIIEPEVRDPQQPSAAPNLNITVPDSQPQEAPPSQTAPAPSSPENPDIDSILPNSQQQPDLMPQTPADESSASEIPEQRPTQQRDETFDRGTTPETDFDSRTELQENEPTAPAEEPELNESAAPAEEPELTEPAVPTNEWEENEPTAPAEESDLTKPAGSV